MPKKSEKPAVKPKMFKSSVDLPLEIRVTMISLLNARLADCFDLHSQCKQAHWNVKGIQFIALHELFDKIAGDFLGFADELAERATALGGYAEGTTRMAAAASWLPEYPVDVVSGKAHLVALVTRVALFGNLIRASIKDSQADAGTADLFTEISRVTDFDLWFLEAHLQEA
jgi:starvation-inducible DNA-binding protein